MADDHTKLQARTSFVFWNRGARGFASVEEHAAPALALKAVRRGGAHPDFDRDGLMHLVVSEHSGRATPLKNISRPRGHWRCVWLAQTGGNSSALGALVYVTAAGRTQMQELGASASYLSQDERVLHFGLGVAMTVDQLRIVWPDGTEKVRTQVTAEQELSFVHPGKYPVRERGEK